MTVVVLSFHGKNLNMMNGMWRESHVHERDAPLKTVAINLIFELVKV